VKVDVSTTTDVFEMLKDEWNALVDKSPFQCVFYMWEWHSTWWEAYHPGDLWVLTCRSDDGRLLGIAPLFVDDAGVLRGIGNGEGSEDVTDYFDFIVDNDCTGPVLECFGQCINTNRNLFDRINISDIPQESPTFELLPQYLRELNFDVTVEQAEVCPVIDLPEDWAGYLDLLDKKYRHELRRKMRRAKGAAEEIDWYIVGEEHDLKAEMDTFLKLMAASDAEKAEFLQHERNLRFFEKIVPIAYENGWLMLNFLTVTDEPVSAYLNFVYDGEVVVYNSGQSHEKYDHLSTGILLLADNIRYAIENGYKKFNFLRGDEPYKYHMGGKDTSVHVLRA